MPSPFEVEKNMDNPGKSGACVNCARNESEIPLLQFRFQEQERWICTTCLPILLHRPGNLVDRLPGADSIKPAKHSHD